MHNIARLLTSGGEAVSEVGGMWRRSGSTGRRRHEVFCRRLCLGLQSCSMVPQLDTGKEQLPFDNLLTSNPWWADERLNLLYLTDVPAPCWMLLLWLLWQSQAKQAFSVFWSPSPQIQLLRQTATNLCLSIQRWQAGGHLSRLQFGQSHPLNNRNPLRLRHS